MRSIAKFFRVTMLWIMLLPWGAAGLGTASNQLVLIANGDQFPVLANPVHKSHWAPDSNGMIDDDHCVMTKSTHLNALADIIDLKDGMYSIGDLLVMLGEWLDTFCAIVWLTLVIRKLCA